MSAGEASRELPEAEGLCGAGKSCHGALNLHFFICAFVKEWSRQTGRSKYGQPSALCSICEKKVTASTLLGDHDLESVLDRNEEIIVRHVFHDGDGKSLDHRWSIAGKEREDLGKLVRLMAEGKKRLGHRV